MCDESPAQADPVFSANNAPTAERPMIWTIKLRSKTAAAAAVPIAAAYPFAG